MQKFSTGFPSLDLLLDGGMLPGELMLVLGTSGSGKTAFCRRMYQANDKGQSTTEKPENPGSNDVLRLRRYNIFVPNANTPTDHYTPEWSKLEHAARLFKNLATSEEEAVIW